MTTIDKLRDITFYIIRKLNDLIINLPIEEQPEPETIVIPNQFPSNLSIDERIEIIRRSLNNEVQTSIEEHNEECKNKDKDKEREKFLNLSIDEKIEYIERNLNNEEEDTKELERIEKFIKDLQKQKDIKETILDYLVKRISKIKELKTNDYIAKDLQNEFNRIILEVEEIDKHLANMDELKRKYNRH